MAIEFRCQECRSFLRTGDETAGTAARCPQCGHIQTVASGTSSITEEATATASISPFASDPQTNPYAAPTTLSTSSSATAQAKVAGPAVGLLVTSMISSLLTGLAVLAGIFSFATGGAEHDDVLAFIAILLSFLLTVIASAGALQMRWLKNHGMAMTAAVVCIAPTNCLWVLTLPVGIWALVVLRDPHVKAAFR